MSTTSLFRVQLLLMLFCLLGCESNLARRVSQYEQVRDDEGARRYLEQVVRANPAQAEAWFLLGRLYLRQEAFTEGRKALLAAREASPRFEEQAAYLLELNFRREYQAGVTALENGMFPEAVEHLQHAVALQPEHAVAHRTLGHAYLALEDAARAADAYGRALALDPRDIQTLNNLAQLAYDRRDFGQAIRFSRDALQYLGDKGPPGMRAQIMERLAYALAQHGRLEEAGNVFSHLALLKNTPEIVRNRALVLFNQQNYALALPHLERALQHQPDDLEILRALGETYYHLEQVEHMIETYEKVLAVAPGDPDALASLVVGYERLGQDERAEAYRRQLVPRRTSSLYR
ncbi:tetratricopeptide repeat protein [Rhodocaloribacter litoris]|uniref:tetratricopeptide repeat protein n=1 Tax=Rhodocaloribacter litoris TaxID=2558931 RepID=UPI0014213F5B|nr:tetratricopeptide repeat protein [Rhodocaloribacter litoris]QXD15907.1 tetratricopeptide repeat protein [Rhodocaloribacter litoris]